jgi:hypothetical protein
LRQLSVERTFAEDATQDWLPEQYFRTKEAKSDDPIIHAMLEVYGVSVQR